ncbi:Mkk2p [Rhizophagus irregularis DAOM 197198w]|uniref:Mkk2p n=1 Tax=Rhizophagus irregularis (strain DAOM 197198w) TaxID=1432141 RepID=A0A015JK66_RHIIW|nr:Mkk2p [Rhizophagus irregularis DAOM 197198w]
MDENLKNYVSKNHNILTWNKKISIMCDIVISISRIHVANIVHKNLHSRNILLSSGQWYICDFEFSRPANKPLYGNLPYVAPEVINGKEFTFASDIYSIGMLMWEISSAQLPFNDYEYDYDLAIKIVNGMRPNIIPGTPLEYSKLIEQCWDADPLKRPNINTLGKELMKIRKSYYQEEPNQSDNNSINSDNLDNLNSKNHDASTSKVHYFEGTPEPKNVTEEKQEDINNISSNSSINQEMNAFQQHIKKIQIDLDDEEKYKNANLHSEDQDNLEIPDGK